MDTTPLPNLENDLSDCGQSCDDGVLIDYFIRVTPHGKFTFDDFVQWITEQEYITRYIVGVENDTANEHYHIVCSCDSEFPDLDLRGEIRWYITPFWADSRGKLPRGFGNKQYNLQVCKDLDAAVSYAVKLKNYVSDGFDEGYIAERAAQSYTKKRPDTFKLQYRLLCDEFQKSTMTTREFMTKFVTLKAQFGQQVQLNVAYSYALSNLVLRDGCAEDLVNKYLSSN